jgi:hypothetical protein
MGLRAIAVAAFAVLLVLPGAASASRLAIEGDTAVYRAGPGEANSGGMNDQEGDYLWVIDFGAEVTAGPGCFEAVHAPARPEYHCDLTGVTNVLLDAGDRNDTVGVHTQVPARVLGGPGRDTLTAYRNKRIEGGEDDDILHLFESGGNTALGGPGTDLATYNPYDYGFDYLTKNVTVTLDGVANDGAEGARDNIGTDVEDIGGSIGHDRLVGDAGPNRITGDRGRDVVEAGGGDDLLLAQDIRQGQDPGHGDTDAADPERDVLRCGPGDDDAYVDDIDSVSRDCELVRVYSGPPRKRFVSLLVLNGGPGPDRLVAAGSVPTRLRGYGGDDRLYAYNYERDSIRCGAGHDRVKADRFDGVATDCEVVLRRGRSG